MQETTAAPPDEVMAPLDDDPEMAAAIAMSLAADAPSAQEVCRLLLPAMVEPPEL